AARRRRGARGAHPPGAGSGCRPGREGRALPGPGDRSDPGGAPLRQRRLHRPLLDGVRHPLGVARGGGRPDEGAVRARGRPRVPPALQLADGNSTAVALFGVEANGRIAPEELDTMNGLVVGDEIAEEHDVAPGDTVTIGGQELVVDALVPT